MVQIEKPDENVQPHRLGFFLGCVIPTEQYAYELSLRKILPALGIELVDLEGFSCCGAPLRSINLNLSRYLSLRNLAICEMAGLDVFAPCPICHLALTGAKNLMVDKVNSEEIEKYNSMLAEEDLEYKGTAEIFHTIDLLYDKIGLEEIKNHVVKPLSKIEFACHYGCHLLRPTLTGRPVHAEHPEKLEELLVTLGASTKDYPEKLNCCGGPLILNLPDSALTKTGQKLKAVRDHGFAGLVDMCPWGHRLFDSRQQNAADTVGEKLDVPVFYISQLVGLSFGMDPLELGLNLNLSSVDKIENLAIFREPGKDENEEVKAENTDDTGTSAESAHEGGS